MSNAVAATRDPSFFELYSRGEATAEQIDDYVDRWHASPAAWTRDMSLHAYLGLTWPEYQAWVKDPAVLPRLLIARRAAK